MESLNFYRHIFNKRYYRDKKARERSKTFKSRVLITVVPIFYFLSVPHQVAPDMRQKL